MTVPISGIFKGYKIDPSTTLSHLFYADDAVFIGEWSHSNLKSIMNILRCFSLLSGMSINIQKSHLLGVGIPDNCVVEAAKSIGCLIMKAPFKYLGSHLVLNIWRVCVGIFLMAFKSKQGDERCLGQMESKVLASEKLEDLGCLVSSLQSGSSFSSGMALHFHDITALWSIFICLYMA
ncbi:hypothetical protein Tco_0922504 [Tanacetum coccineum]|uniref:RNA-directed DNA polymerase, eukaryota n=1 Tax=Tanacetum coccineum TaxID=301880 RepID=A0ABQ5CY95_9ASTR